VIDAKRYSLSTHPDVIDKPGEVARRRLGRGWTPFELSETAIADNVRAGRPLAPQYRGGNRKTVNFVCAGFLAADVDRGMTLDEARNHPFVLHHASLVHTTVSHTAERDRFRIIFLLDEPVLNAADWADAQLGIALEMGSDATVTDGGRLLWRQERDDLSYWQDDPTGSRR
jgi:hypothetical protein